MRLVLLLLLLILVVACQDTTNPILPAAAACSVSQLPDGALISCPNATSVFIPNGEPGLQGPVGEMGPAGTSVSVVQFCKGFVSQYPDSFPEQGLCIGGKLYGVYWNGSTAFLAFLPPGAYVSTSLSNTVCSFTVNANCEVTQ